jgi:hypothetical protein
MGRSTESVNARLGAASDRKSVGKWPEHEDLTHFLGAVWPKMSNNWLEMLRPDSSWCAKIRAECGPRVTTSGGPHVRACGRARLEPRSPDLTTARVDSVPPASPRSVLPDAPGRPCETYSRHCFTENNRPHSNLGRRRDRLGSRRPPPGASRPPRGPRHVQLEVPVRPCTRSTRCWAFCRQNDT